MEHNKFLKNKNGYENKNCAISLYLNKSHFDFLLFKNLNTSMIVRTLLDDFIRENFKNDFELFLKKQNEKENIE